ncbi:putative heme d1 biosynthesis radical SAM protein NirJ2 [Clostridium magnum]|uniref:Antilisterial bacteriocin subtilosin biosynthesis protein AlbA n=1 Tax=Clostridium magnum DSM 2767 TaxID=1121326 RepID=A0A161WF63_9CLOT|nr:putative heme d1 biosynthesis radical SAM protein NirJ2 [Clostridium magnum]KZL90285.1 antilisterial bacteriocin subtilosin biosynthesis protein AlbA [Clostridium magnum DSM 2767]SHH81094.1 putative heme d1 biosynthesis radical SAM protein NirJ2 [Clostridium magnum DSM 2767]
MIISWNTTNKCNLKCNHCYRDSGKESECELTTKEAKLLIDQIAATGFKIMIFSGGEPLMREDIFDLINYAGLAGLRPVLGSNGTLISKKTAEELKKAGIAAVGISLDSLDAKKHNNFRGYNDAFRHTICAMKNCRESGIRFQIHTTVMDWNKSEIISITDFAVGVGASAHHIFFLVPTGRGKNIKDELLNSEEYEELLTSIMKKQQQVEIEIKPTCAPQFIRIAQSLNTDIRFKRGCLAGISYCIINPRGDVQACAYLDEVAGNVREKSFDDIWKNSSLFNNLRSQQYSGSCGSCKYKKSCGGCRARAAYYNNGDYMASENLCLYSKALSYD